MQPDPSFYIETPRLFLSHPIVEDPKHCQLISNLYFSSNTEKAKGFISGRSNSLLARLGHGIYLCSLKTESNKLEDAIPVGVITLIRGDETQEGETAYTVPDVGFQMLPDEMRKGYATEGAQAVIKYATETLGYKGVLGFTGPANIASQRTLEKTGLEYRGERNLVAFGGERSRVYALRGMGDLKEYNIADDNLSS